MNEKPKGEFFADFDEESQMWCVFHTDVNTGHAYSSFADKEDAALDADGRNLFSKKLLTIV